MPAVFAMIIVNEHGLQFSVSLKLPSFCYDLVAIATPLQLTKTTSLRGIMVVKI